MAYILGINVPLTEIMFILIILLTAGLALVLIELRKLRQLIQKERVALHEFEQDLQRLEADEGKLRPEQVRQVVQTHMQNGVPQQHIQQALQNKGWQQNQIKKVFQ